MSQGALALLIYISVSVMFLLVPPTKEKKEEHTQAEMPEEEASRGLSRLQLHFIVSRYMREERKRGRRRNYRYADTPLGHLDN